MDRKTNHTSSILRLFAIAAISAAFLAVCSLSTTPLLQYYPGQDSAFFRLVGLGMTKGMLPYRDFFDMKGPYLFWLEWLGQVIAPGRLGAYLVQWLCMTVSVYFIAKCLNLAKKTPLWVLGLALLPMGYIMSYTMTGGNLTEELSMPFLMPCLYLFLRWLIGGGGAHNVRAGFFYGVVFGVMALIRVTNAALIGAILLTVTCDLIFGRQWRNLLVNAGMFLLGIAAGVLPGILWCRSRGILGEMLSQVFFFGFAYSEESGLMSSLSSMGQVRLCLLLPLLPLIPLVLYREKDWRCWLFFAASAATVTLAAMMGNGYCHYFVLSIPNMVFAAFLFVWEQGRKAGRKGRMCGAIALCLTAAVLAAQWPLFRPRALEEVRYAMYCAANKLEDREEYDAVQAVMAKVPAEEPMYVYGFASCSAVYIQADRLPPIKYCDWQPHYIQLDKEIGREIESFLSSENSRWVVTPVGEIEPESIQSILEERYTSIFQAGNCRLWEKK